MLSEQISAEVIFFFILYGITGVVPLIAAIYLLLRRGNAFAPGVTPPVRLRHWAASLFVVAALGHVWWYLFFIYSRDIYSVCYVAIAMLDYVLLLTTIAGTLLAMLQDRQRPVWPAIVALIPLLALGVLLVCDPDGPYIQIATVYVLSLYVLFCVYMVFAVRRYGQWLNDNYADLENKKVWLTQVVSQVCLLLFILYALVDTDTVLVYIMHVIELVFCGLLLWRVETLPCLTSNPIPEQSLPIGSLSPSGEVSEDSQGCSSTEELSTPLAPWRGDGGEAPFNIDLAQIEQLLAEHCVATKLYLQHDLSLQQLSRTIGTNRSYLSQYFSRQGITYNTYINNLRINYFISRYQEVVSTQQPFTVQQLANESGYRSYSTFSLAFKQRTGQTVTAWMRQTTE